MSAKSESDTFRKAIARHDDHYGFGSMSCTIYDTAWASLVTKVVEQQKQWLFPRSFQYLLDTQSPNGGWPATASHVDGILNGASSLLSLSRHAKEPLQISIISQEDIQRRIASAVDSLQSQLAAWNVSITTHIGFEVIVPSLLGQLEAEGFSFDFDGRSELYKLRAEKLAGFKPEFLYGKRQSTALHSLEAFVGEIDFDRVAQHKILGSMMASPSSTAAYLIHASKWDDEAEAYLRHVVDVSPEDNASVPSTYPSNYYEYTWILSTLLRYGFSYSDLESSELMKMIETISQAFEEGNGVVGFGPQLNYDVGDTAKGIMLLSMLQSERLKTVMPEKMITMFATDTHFRTYIEERDPSYNANCNALLALVHHPDALSYSEHIVKIVKFLCDGWWKSDGMVKDKRNISYLYSTLILVEALTDVLILIEDKFATERFFSNDLTTRIYITLFQACLRTILQQQQDGSWSSSVEQTAYGVLVLSEARRLSFFNELKDQIESALDTGVRFLVATEEQSVPPDYLRIEKISYRSSYISEAYVLAALRASSRPLTPVNLRESIHANDVAKKAKAHLKLFQATPLFSETPEWQLRASQIEGSLFQSLLEAQRFKTFPRADTEAGKYFDIIPFTWTACNNKSLTFVSTSSLYEMMIISVQSYQTDEFMEGVAGPEFAENHNDLRVLVERIFAADRNIALMNKHEKVITPLSRLVFHMLQHPAVLSASRWDQMNVKREIQACILAHVTQIEHNKRFARGQDKETYSSVPETMFHWVRTTSSEHTSCLSSFAFLSCLISSTLTPGEDCFPTATQKYLSEAACRHLATMCRMYNDFGSVARDRIEGNVNSINFPEFQTPQMESTSSKKEVLFGLAEYERSCLDHTLRRLNIEADLPNMSSKAKEIEKRKMAIWRMFVDVTDLYGQIYVIRDISTRMKAAESGANPINAATEKKWPWSSQNSLFIG
ncbi:hypothetical protein CHU98_g9351 [Xylaria longipes]|nr:hypothetical protein CHU98_g9351 [Xylaria longipes]